MSADVLLTLNAGFSTAKIALFEVAESGARRVAKGTIDFRKNRPSFRVTEGATTFDGTSRQTYPIFGVSSRKPLPGSLIISTRAVSPAGPRVVHGVTLSPVRCVRLRYNRSNR